MGRRGINEESKEAIYNTCNNKDKFLNVKNWIIFIYRYSISIHSSIVTSLSSLHCSEFGMS